VIALQLDLAGDGSLLIDVQLCGECARRFGRFAGEVVIDADSVADANKDDEGKALPWIAPICGKCLKSWRERTNFSG
jgi:hypothetical protein